MPLLTIYPVPSIFYLLSKNNCVRSPEKTALKQKTRGKTNEISSPFISTLLNSLFAEASNSVWNKTRSGVERTFAHLKGKQGLGQARYFGLDRNTQWAVMNAIAYNLSRAINILSLVKE